LIAHSAEIWYSQRVESLFHAIFKEKSMPKSRTGYLLNSTLLFCIDNIVAGIIEPGRQR
jgi:hypothetical protein